MFEDTPLVMVEDEHTLRTVVDRLSTASVIALDTESDSSYAYQEKVCLIQVSDLHNDYIIDPLSVGSLAPLADLLADREITKVLHGADYDIVCLKRDFGFHIGGLFDTLIAAQLLGMPRIGLADLIARFFGIELDKQFQRYNWALRPLLPEHIEYARGDTHFLLALREILDRSLRAAGRRRHFVEECRILERREWQGRRFDEEGWLDLKRVQTLDAAGRRVLRRLYLYRDRQARKMDRPSYKVIPDDVLVDIAQARPRSESDLDRVVPARSALRRRHGRALLEEVALALNDDGPLPDPTRRAKPKEKDGPARSGGRKRAPPVRLRGRQAERVLSDLKQWRIEVLGRDPQLNAFSVASNATLKSIASARPRTLAELAGVPEVRRWQVQDFGEELLERLNRSAPLNGDSDED
jgi:ribonuclease D